MIIGDWYIYIYCFLQDLLYVVFFYIYNVCEEEALKAISFYISLDKCYWLETSLGVWDIFSQFTEYTIVNMGMNYEILHKLVEIKKTAWPRVVSNVSWNSITYHGYYLISPAIPMYHELTRWIWYSIICLFTYIWYLVLA